MNRHKTNLVAVTSDAHQEVVRLQVTVNKAFTVYKLYTTDHLHIINDVRYCLKHDQLLLETQGQDHHDETMAAHKSISFCEKYKCIL